MTSITNEEYKLRKRHIDSKIKDTWQSIIDKYSAYGLADQGDVIDLHTGEVVEDNGHLRSLNRDSGLFSDALGDSDTKQVCSKVKGLTTRQLPKKARRSISNSNINSSFHKKSHPSPKATITPLKPTDGELIPISGSVKSTPGSARKLSDTRKFKRRYTRSSMTLKQLVERNIILKQILDTPGQKQVDNLNILSTSPSGKLSTMFANISLKQNLSYESKPRNQNHEAKIKSKKGRNLGDATNHGKRLSTSLVSSPQLLHYESGSGSGNGSPLKGKSKRLTKQEAKAKQKTQEPKDKHNVLQSDTQDDSRFIDGNGREVFVVNPSSDDGSNSEFESAADHVLSSQNLFFNSDAQTQSNKMVPETGTQSAVSDTTAKNGVHFDEFDDSEVILVSDSRLETSIATKDDTESHSDSSQLHDASNEFVITGQSTTYNSKSESLFVHKSTEVEHEKRQVENAIDTRNSSQYGDDGVVSTDVDSDEMADTFEERDPANNKIFSISKINESSYDDSGYLEDDDNENLHPMQAVQEPNTLLDDFDSYMNNSAQKTDNTTDDANLDSTNLDSTDLSRNDQSRSFDNGTFEIADESSTNNESNFLDNPEGISFLDEGISFLDEGISFLDKDIADAESFERIVIADMELSTLSIYSRSSDGNLPLPRDNRADTGPQPTLTSAPAPNLAPRAKNDQKKEHNSSGNMAAKWRTNKLYDTLAEDIDHMFDSDSYDFETSPTKKLRLI